MVREQHHHLSKSVNGSNRAEIYHCLFAAEVSYHLLLLRELILYEHNTIQKHIIQIKIDETKKNSQVLFIPHGGKAAAIWCLNG